MAARICYSSSEILQNVVEFKRSLMQPVNEKGEICFPASLGEATSDNCLIISRKSENI